MKFIFLFEILGLLLFSSLFITEIQDIQDAGPLPQNTALPTLTTREEVATINLNGTEIFLEPDLDMMSSKPNKTEKQPKESRSSKKTSTKKSLRAPHSACRRRSAQRQADLYCTAPAP